MNVKPFREGSFFCLIADYIDTDGVYHFQSFKVERATGRTARDAVLRVCSILREQGYKPYAVRWVKGPSCGRRCRLLYHHRVRFKCRQCARLNYSSQQVTKGPDEAAHRLNQFLQNKFGQDKRLSPMELTYLLPPDRPKGMHQKTYERLLREYDQLYSEYDRAFVVHALKTLPFLAQAIQRQSVA